MKTYDLSANLLDLDGRPFYVDEEGNFSIKRTSKPLTVARLATISLATAKQESGEKKADCWELAVRIRQNGETCDLSESDVRTIRDAISEVWGSPLISGQAWGLIREAKRPQVAPRRKKGDGGHDD